MFSIASFGDWCSEQWNDLEFFHNYTKLKILALKGYLRDSEQFSVAKKLPPVKFDLRTSDLKF